jgi:hypothetical protein
MMRIRDYGQRRYELLIEEGVEWVHQRAKAGGDIFHAIDTFVEMNWNDEHSSRRFAKDIEDTYFIQYGYLDDEYEFAKGRDDDEAEQWERLNPSPLENRVRLVEQFWEVVSRNYPDGAYGSPPIINWDSEL